MASQSARRWFIRGRVQGVGFRHFTLRAASQIGLHGYARNLDDGRVEVYAVGGDEQLSRLSGILRVGPRWAEVRGVDEEEAELHSCASFEIR